VNRTGRKLHAPWPVRQKTARRKRPATPVAMTDQGMNKVRGLPTIVAQLMM
jgi:hypothetical protein